jgi:hypothetical protein
MAFNPFKSEELASLLESDAARQATRVGEVSRRGWGGKFKRSLLSAGLKGA